MNTDNRLNEIYHLLFNRYGKQNWWPGESKLECAVGAILTQNTFWSNVEKAIMNIKSAMNISEENLSAISIKDLSVLIKPSGFYNLKAQRIKGFIDFINSSYGGRIENMETADSDTLRSELLSIKGIGPETADCILLYSLEKPYFVADKYTFRLLFRHGIVDGDTGYAEIQNVFMDNLERDTQLYGEFHALIVEVGKNHCGKKAVCSGCPLDRDPHPMSGAVI